MSRERALSRERMRELDRRAIDEFGIPGVVLMENAGRGAAERIATLYPAVADATIVCGGGNNGGDGFVIARYLANGGWTVRVLLTSDPSRLSPDAAVFHRVASRMAIPIEMCADPAQLSRRLAAGRFVVDALLGTGFSGAMRAPMEGFIEAINQTPEAAVIAVDIPSGLEADTGQPCPVAVRAAHTITFVARKIGFDAPGAAAYTGAVHVVNIGIPAMLLDAE